MRGLVCYGEEKKEEKILLGGIGFLNIYVRRGEGFLARLSARRAAQHFRHHQVREVVFPVDYPHGDLFAVRGIFPPDPRSLQLGMAAEIFRAAVENQAASRVIFVGEHVTADLYRAICALRQEIRYFAADIGGGSEKLARELKCLYGLALESGVSAQQCRQGDLALLFSPWHGWEDALCRKIILYREDPALEYRLSEKLQVEGVEEKQLAAALYGVGALNGTDLQVKFPVLNGEERKLPL